MSVTSGQIERRFRSEKAVSPTTGNVAWVIVDTATYELHPEGTTFAASLRRRGLSSNTERNYTGRTALYLSYSAARGIPWQSPTMNQLSGFLHWLVDVPLPARSRREPLEPRFRKKQSANAVVTTTCEFLRFGVRQEWVPVDLGMQLSNEKHLVYLPRGYQAGRTGSSARSRRRSSSSLCPTRGLRGCLRTKSTEWCSARPAPETASSSVCSG